MRSRSFLLSILLILGAHSAEAKVKIGQSCALSGPTEELGKEMKRGADAFFSSVSDVELVSLDDKYEPAKTVENTNKLNADGVTAFFGYVGTPTSKEALPIIMGAKKVFFSQLTGAGFLSDAAANPYSFAVRGSYDQETELMVDRLSADKGIKKIAIFVQDDAFGDVGKSGVEKALKKRSLTMAAEGRYKRNTIAVKEGADTVLAAGAEAVIMVGAYKPCATAIKYMRGKGFKGPIINISFVGPQSLAKELEGARENVYVTQVVPSPWDASVPVVKEYQDKVKTDFGFISLEGFISAKIFHLGLTKAGASATSESLKAAFEGMSKVDIGGLSVTFSPTDHRALEKVYFSVINPDGSFKYLEKM